MHAYIHAQYYAYIHDSVHMYTYTSLYTYKLCIRHINILNATRK